jgi:hypothetical protein
LIKTEPDIATFSLGVQTIECPIDWIFKTLQKFCNDFSSSQPQSKQKQIQNFNKYFDDADFLSARNYLNAIRTCKTNKKTLNNLKDLQL